MSEYTNEYNAECDGCGKKVTWHDEHVRVKCGCCEEMNTLCGTCMKEGTEEPEIATVQTGH